MLAHWFQRELGQIVAPPDPSSPPPEHPIDEEDDGIIPSSLWQIVAPDPNYAPPKQKEGMEYTLPRGEGESCVVEGTPPVSAFRSASVKVEPGGMVECVHCHKLTPWGAVQSPSSPNSIPSTPAATASEPPTPFTTPPAALNECVSPFNGVRSAQISSELQSQVLAAATDTAFSLTSPPHKWESRKNFFAMCASSSELSEKQRKRFKKMLSKDPSLVEVRSVDLGNLVPDGFTPLHAAAYAGNVDAAKILIDFEITVPKDDEGGGDVAKEGEEKLHQSYQKVKALSLYTVDVKGWTALHVASERGHVTMVKLIKDAMSSSNASAGLGPPMGEDAPIDLTGRTPLGYAITSREASARKNRKELEDVLFSPGDESVSGRKTPAKERGGGTTGKKSRHNSTMRRLAEEVETDEETPIYYGFSDMIGWRGGMEDAMCHHILLPPQTFKNVGFFGVFDGHGDGGIVSGHVASNLANAFCATEEWKGYLGSGTNPLAQGLMKSCVEMDEELKRLDFKGGGSTGVVAVVTGEVVIVGNVGDSRCILVQRKEEDKVEEVPALVEDMGRINLQDAKGEAEPSKSEVESMNKESRDATTAEEGQALDVATSTEVNEKDEEGAVGSVAEKPLAQSIKDDAVGALVVQALSEDHKPNLANERARIDKAGMMVIPEILPKSPAENTATTGEAEDEQYDTIWKIQKSERETIAVSRAFGDFDYKSNPDVAFDEQAIIATPDIRVHGRDPERDLVLVLACDGVWDVMSNDEVGAFVIRRMREIGRRVGLEPQEVLAKVGDALLLECLDRGSRDNMSVMIVSLASPTAAMGLFPSVVAGGGGGLVARRMDFELAEEK